jgi:hypothetical protein
MKIKRGLQILLGCIILIIAATVAPRAKASPATISPNTFIGACTGEYFNNTSLSGSPVLVRTDSAINFYWPEYTSPGTGVSTSAYSVRWTCSTTVNTAGTYTFTIRADDGMNLLVDGNLLIWAWYDQGSSYYSNSIYLSAGTHTIRVEYYNNSMGGTAQVYSNLASPTDFTATTTTILTSGLLSNCTGSYYNNITLSGTPAFVRVDPLLNFTWSQYDSPGSGLDMSGYSVRWTCVMNTTTARGYTISAVTDDGMNAWVDNNYVIGAWYDQSATNYSNSIYLDAGTHVVVVEYYNRVMGGTAKVSIQ